MSYKSTPVSFNAPVTYPVPVETLARKKPTRRISDQQVMQTQQSQNHMQFIQQQRNMQSQQDAPPPDVYALMDALSDKELSEYMQRRNIDVQCSAVINHVCACKLCSSIVNPSQTIYIIIIIVLCLAVIYLFNKLIDVTYK